MSGGFLLPSLHLHNPPSTSTIHAHTHAFCPLACRYLRDKSLEREIADAQVFGWTRKNELGNGRWVMMGLAIGMLTEYATGVSFIDQLKLMVSYMGLIDLD